MAPAVGRMLARYLAIGESRPMLRALGSLPLSRSSGAAAEDILSANHRLGAAPRRSPGPLFGLNLPLRFGLERILWRSQAKNAARSGASPFLAPAVISSEHSLCDRISRLTLCHSDHRIGIQIRLG